MVLVKLAQWRSVFVLLCLCLFLPPSNAAEQVSLDGKVSASFTGLVLNRTTNTFDAQATITNTSAETIVAPLSLVITGITPTSVSLANPAGQTAGAKPYVEVPLPAAGLLPGASVSKVLLKFNNPSRVRFSFTHSLLGIIAAADKDRDGFTSEQGDCDDNNANVHPGAAERCNGVDDNCNATADEGFDVGVACSAGVGVCASSGVKVCSTDGLSTSCNAAPGTPATETCNGLDDNCNAQTDENLGNLSCGIGACQRSVAACLNGASQACVPGTPTVEICGNGIDEDCNGADLLCTGGDDTQAPSLSINAPANGSFVLLKRPAIDVSYSDPSGVKTDQLSLSLNGDPLQVDCTVTDSMAHCTPQVDLPDGAITLAASVPDTVGNVASAESRFTVDTVPLAIDITLPANGLITRDADVQVTGTVGAGVSSVKVNDVAANISGNQFSATVPLREGTNMLVALGVKANGKTGTASIDVTRDIFAPIVRIDSPSDKFVSPNDRVPVTGLVNDVVTGNTKAVVRVNGIEATVGDGTFMVPEVPLVRGPNTIEVVATDSVGNVGRHSITVTYEQPVGARLSILSGNGQAAVVNQPLPQALVAVIKDDLGNPVAGRIVRFEVTRNSGTLKTVPADTPAQIVQIPTDGSGRASVNLMLGNTAGEGNNRVTASAVGVTGAIEFCASSLAMQAQKILMTMGDNQRGVVGHPLATPLEALVVDQTGNPINGVDVTFAVTKGSGNLDGQSTKVVKTVVDGTARAVFTLGADPGINNNVVNATFEGLAGAAATFVASGLTPGIPADTKFSGVVLDNGHTPIPGVVVKIDGTTVSDTTDAEGQFLLENVPVGHIHLLIDPANSPRPETFPPLAFETVTIAGQTNILGQPILLPALDTAGSKIVGGNQDVVLKMKGVAGLELTVFKNSVTCPPGTPDRSADGKQCRISINQVHLDKVPMPPPNGLIFTPPAWSVQPHGVAFDPPARISMPNNGLPPGQIIDIFQFDHTLNEFINVGKGTVSKDAAVIVSDSGFGITRAGWGGGGPPPPPTTCVSSCDDKNICTSDGCSNGSCVHTASNASLPDAPNDCKDQTCQGASLVTTNDDSEQPTDLCKFCENGQQKDKTLRLGVSQTKSWAFPSAYIDSVNARLAPLRAEISYPTVSVTGNASDCCVPETGTIVPFAKSELTGKADIGVKLGARIWPPGPKIDFGIGIGFPGFGSVAFTVELDGGVFLEGEVTLGGAATLVTDACKGLDQCIQVAVGYDFTPRADARFEAKSCTYTDCFFCDPTKSCQSVAASLISAAWKFCGALSYNKPCDSGFGGVGIANGGLTVTIGKVSATVQDNSGQPIVGDSFDGFTFGPFFASDSAGACR